VAADFRARSRRRSSRARGCCRGAWGPRGGR
jgi:hypothetical protein